MGLNLKWVHYAGLGIILVAITFFDIAPSGPWNDSRFTSGSIGLVGLFLLYIAWFKVMFGDKGIVPTLDRWKDPVGTAPKVIGVGIATLIVAYSAGRVDFFPEPAGLLLTGIGLLILTNGIYVWLVSYGLLSDEEE
ncbi:MAG: hypothetical protein QGI21_05170 [Candidatus Poseidoniaceae archaeon]|jgi:hypothetical protein|nr:hypothetical protein [Candidatus Poseidoniaceae archaeon]